MVGETQSPIFHVLYTGFEKKKKTCSVCKEIFWATNEHKYLAHVHGKTEKVPVCSWHCVREVEQKEDAARKKREEKRRIAEEKWQIAEDKRLERIKAAEKKAEKKAEQKTVAMTARQIMLKLDEAHKKHIELLMFYDSAAYRRMTEAGKQKIRRRMWYWNKRKNELKKELEELKEAEG